MTQDEIRKLLGGYATDALTPGERQTLFKAALEDQELFNALANEDALKALLDDPVTRAQARAAVRPRRRQFHARRWLLGVAIPAVVAVALVVMMNRAGAPRLVATNDTPRAKVNPPAPSPAPGTAVVPPVAPPNHMAQTKPPRLTKRAEATPRAIPKAPLPESVASLEQAGARPRAEARAVVPALATLRALSPASIPPGVVRQINEGSRSQPLLYQGPLVQYAVMRSGPNGRAIRVQVTAGVGGYVALYEVNSAGRAIRVYPAGEAGAPIAANLPVQIPPEPIEIHQAGTKLRLVVVPAPVPAAQEFLPRAQAALRTGEAASAPLAPLVVEIPLAP